MTVLHLLDAGPAIDFGFYDFGDGSFQNTSLASNLSIFTNRHRASTSPLWKEMRIFYLVFQYIIQYQNKLYKSNIFYYIYAFLEGMMLIHFLITFCCIISWTSEYTLLMGCGIII